jgi:hypothetical protein
LKESIIMQDELFLIMALSIKKIPIYNENNSFIYTIPYILNYSIFINDENI